MYLLLGNDKDVSNVIKEQRIRIGRGVIRIIPASDAGLSTEDDVRKMIDDATKNLVSSIGQKDKEIMELKDSIDQKEIRIKNLESEIKALNDVIPVDDETIELDDKTIVIDDSKDVNTTDDKAIIENDDKNLNDVVSSLKKRSKKG